MPFNSSFKFFRQLEGPEMPVPAFHNDPFDDKNSDRENSVAKLVFAQQPLRINQSWGAFANTSTNPATYEVFPRQPAQQYMLQQPHSFRKTSE